MHPIQVHCKHLFTRLGTEHMAISLRTFIPMHLEYKTPTSTRDTGTKHMLGQYAPDLETVVLPAVLLTAAASLPLHCSRPTVQGHRGREPATAESHSQGQSVLLVPACKEPFMLDSFNGASVSPVPSRGLKHQMCPLQQGLLRLCLTHWQGRSP